MTRQQLADLDAVTGRLVADTDALDARVTQAVAEAEVFAAVVAKVRRRKS